jgi:3''5''-cyclic nucleotide phosphodiesterase.
VVYDDKSALEQMHCQLLLHVMRQHGLDALLDSPSSGTQVRRLLWEIVLATDMSVHFDFMTRFKSIVNGQEGPICLRQILISQAIMKCSDISNPVSKFLFSDGAYISYCTESTIPRITALGLRFNG